MKEYKTTDFERLDKLPQSTLLELPIRELAPYACYLRSCYRKTQNELKQQKAKVYRKELALIKARCACKRMSSLIGKL